MSIEKTPPKVGYFRNIAETFSTALMPQSSQKQEGTTFI
jgi:hypothetical protein